VEEKVSKSKRKKSKRRSAADSNSKAARSPKDAVSESPKRRKSSKHKRKSKASKSSRSSKASQSKATNTGKRQKAHPENPGTVNTENEKRSESVSTDGNDRLHTARGDVHGNIGYFYSPEGGHRSDRMDRTDRTDRGNGRPLGTADIMEGRFSCTVFYEWMAGLCTMGPVHPFDPNPRIDTAVHYDDDDSNFEPGSFDDSYHSYQSYDQY